MNSCSFAESWFDMLDPKNKFGFQFFLAKFLRHFFQGLIVIAPIGITVYAVWFLFNWVDDILPNLLHAIAPSMIGLYEDGSPKKIPGLGFVLVLVLVWVVGWLSSLFMVGRLVDVFDKVLENTPGIKLIYTSVKDFLEAFAGNKKKFNQPVLVDVDNNNMWRVGFITQQTAADFGLPDHVTVYIPFSYAISGMTCFVPADRIKPLKNISAANAMKYAVSGGVSDVE